MSCSSLLRVLPPEHASCDACSGKQAGGSVCSLLASLGSGGLHGRHALPCWGSRPHPSAFGHPCRATDGLLLVPQLYLLHAACRAPMPRCFRTARLQAPHTLPGTSLICHRPSSYSYLLRAVPTARLFGNQTGRVIAGHLSPGAGPPPPPGPPPVLRHPAEVRTTLPLSKPVTPCTTCPITKHPRC